MKSREFPQLETPRLLLRKLVETDWESVSYLRTDELVNQFVERPKAETREKALEFIERIRGFVDSGVSHYWCVCLKDDPEMIGSVCLWNFSEDRRIAEIGYDLKPRFQNRGLMSEAVQAVIDYGFRELKLERIEAFTHRKNESSKKLLLKNHFQLNPERRDEEFLENIIFEIYREAAKQ